MPQASGANLMQLLRTITCCQGSGTIHAQSYANNSATFFTVCDYTLWSLLRESNVSEMLRN